MALEFRNLITENLKVEKNTGSVTAGQVLTATDSAGNVAWDNISGDILTKDGLVKVDTTNKRVGINTPFSALPQYSLHVSSPAGTGGVIEYISSNAANANVTSLQINNSIAELSITRVIDAQLDDWSSLGATVTYGSGLVVNALSASINNIHVRIGGTSDITGNYAVYSDSAYQSYFAGKIGIGVTAPGAKLHVVGSSDVVQEIFKAHSTQTANITEWQNSGGTVLAAISGTGVVVPSGVSITGGTSSSVPLIQISTSTHQFHALQVQTTNASAKAGIRVTNGTKDTMIWKDGQVIVRGSSSSTPVFDLDVYGQIYVVATDSGTTNAIEALRLGHRTSATPAVTFGVQMSFYGDTTTHVNAEIGHVEGHWADPTHASRKGRLLFYTASSSNVYEGFRIENNGSVALLSFFANAAVGQQTVTGSRGGNAALASLLTALANYGIIVNSSS